MSGIAGINQPGKTSQVRRMLEKMAHRGQRIEIVEAGAATLGVVYSAHQAQAAESLKSAHLAVDAPGAGHFALAQGDKFLLKRGRLGVAPLYYGWTAEGDICFASEVKGMLGVAREARELLPGHAFDGSQQETFDILEKQPPLSAPPQEVAHELRRRLEAAVEQRINGSSTVGAWLSGGIDSSALAALARPHVPTLHTFTAGLPGAPDVEHAQAVAEFIHAEHHVRMVSTQDLLAALPQVIYHLESFDAWLVRSSIMNYLVAQLAAEYVPMVFSGEGGDELFAGYEYLKTLNPAALPDELVDITRRLHNTALQRVDRSAAAHGITAHVALLDPDIVDYALRIPPAYKLHNGVEKWILRQAVADLLPAAVVQRPKAKFWQGAGVEDLLAQHAESQISDVVFARERQLPNGWRLNTKEEMLYYRIFRERFGDFIDLAWMGRTKGSPVN